MIVVGIDPHKATHTAIAVNSNGAVIDQITVKARDTGHQQLLGWAACHGQVLWAVEDGRHVTGRLERALLAAGQQVVRVPPKLMGQTRRGSRERGKSDPIDATAVARVALREPDLPAATLDQHALEARLLVDRREQLVAERTREICRLIWHAHDLDPDLTLGDRRLRRHIHVAATADLLDDLPGPRARVAREILDRIDVLNHAIDGYERDIAALVRQHWPTLLDIEGCGPLTAAKLVGEVGDPHRFASAAKFAMHAGTAPIPASSGNSARVRLNRAGNRQLNAAIHRIALTQTRRPGSRGRAYRDRKISEGKTKREATRALKRQLSNVVYRALREAVPPSSLT